MLERSPDMRGEVKIIDIEDLMPKNHVLRKIDKVIDFTKIYVMTEKFTLRSQTTEWVFAKTRYALYIHKKPPKGTKLGVRLKFAAMNLKKMVMWA